MIINRITGKPPTPAELRAIKARAVEIFRNPYVSPEQLKWAIECHPEGMAELMIMESVNHFNP